MLIDVYHQQETVPPRDTTLRVLLLLTPSLMVESSIRRDDLSLNHLFVILLRDALQGGGITTNMANPPNQVPEPQVLW